MLAASGLEASSMVPVAVAKVGALIVMTTKEQARTINNALAAKFLVIVVRDLPRNRPQFWQKFSKLLRVELHS